MPLKKTTKKMLNFSSDDDDDEDSAHLNSPYQNIWNNNQQEENQPIDEENLFQHISHDLMEIVRESAPR